MVTVSNSWTYIAEELKWLPKSATERAQDGHVVMHAVIHMLYNNIRCKNIWEADLYNVKT